MGKRPFRRVKGTGSVVDKFAVDRDYRPVVFNCATADGGTIEFEGSVLPEDTQRLVEIFTELNELHRTKAIRK